MLLKSLRKHPRYAQEIARIPKSSPKIKPNIDFDQLIVNRLSRNKHPKGLRGTPRLGYSAQDRAVGISSTRL